MIRKTLLIAMPLALMLVSLVNAQGPGFGKMAEELGLTDQQIDQLENLRLTHQKEMVRMNADLKLARLELKKVMIKDKLDEKAALSRQERISSIRASIDRKKIEHKIAMRKVLNEEQQAKWNKMRRDFGPRDGRHRMDRGPHHRMGRGMRMGPGPEVPDAPEPPEPPE